MIRAGQADRHAALVRDLRQLARQLQGVRLGPASNLTRQPAENVSPHLSRTVDRGHRERRACARAGTGHRTARLHDWLLDGRHERTRLCRFAPAQRTRADQHFGAVQSCCQISPIAIRSLQRRSDPARSEMERRCVHRHVVPGENGALRMARKLGVITYGSSLEWRRTLRTRPARRRTARRRRPVRPRVPG